MSTSVLDPISIVTTPDSEQESEFELDVRIDASLPDPEPVNGSYPPQTSGSDCCPHSSMSIWYSWCCN